VIQDLSSIPISCVPSCFFVFQSALAADLRSFFFVLELALRRQRGAAP
jgi:hypothetical protein